MPQDPFPDPGPDGEEPGSSPLPPAAEEDGPGLGQGLYMCLPPEQLTLAGFAQNGEADTMPPGPLLATVVDTVTGEDGAGLTGCSDDQLLGIISAARRMTARAEWTSMAAMNEFAARHPGSSPEDEFAADELAHELHLTPPSSSSGRWTCAPPGCPAPCKNSACAPTSTYCKNATAATSPPGPSPMTTQAGTADRAVPVPVLVLVLVPVPVPVPLQVLRPGRAWPRWSPSPSPGPPTRTSPTRLARPAGSACWTATRPATWPPPQQDTLAPAGASPR